MPEPPRRALLSTLDQFCHDHSISRAFFYKLQKQGRGPVAIKLGARTMISVESAAEWRHRMDAESRAA